MVDTIFQLYRHDQFNWCRKLDYPEVVVNPTTIRPRRSRLPHKENEHPYVVLKVVRDFMR
jgi:hypothetical protein